MTFQLILDENIPKTVVEKLLDNNHQIIAIRTEFPGKTDKEIIKLSKDKRQPILTMDKDFGFLVYKEKLQPYCVILLRIKPQSPEMIYSTIKLVLNEIERLEINLEDKFLVFDGKTLRIRKLEV